MKKLVLALLAALLLLATWGLVEPRVLLDETYEQAEIPGLPAHWDGRRIAVLADWQVGMWWANEDMVRRALAQVVQASPAALLIAGDFLYKPVDEESVPQAREDLEAEDLREVRSQIGQVTRLVRPVLAAGIPVYAVLGNHDYLKDEIDEIGALSVADDLVQALREAGVTVLRNEAVVMRAPGQAQGEPLYLGGIDSLVAGRADPQRMLAAIPPGAPRIVLMHHPDLFEKLPPSSAPLAVAGHTHGGQIRVPGLPHWSWMTLKQGGRVTTDGWIQNYGAAGNRLYVNRGIGFSSVPMRVNCAPELTWFTLVGLRPP